MRIVYKMSCKCCKYCYCVDVLVKPTWEICPICGHSVPFDEFNDGEIKRYGEEHGNQRVCEV